MDTVNIKNTRPSLVVLPPAEGQRKPTRLMPGENDVRKDVWEAAKTRKAIAIWIGAGILEERPGRAVPLPTKASAAEKAKASGRRADDLSDFDVEQIQTIVADTDDLGLLGAWGDDPREEVQAIVRARMSALKKARKGRRKK